MRSGTQCPAREPHRRQHCDRPRLDRRLPRRGGALPELARRAAVRQLRHRELPRRRRPHRAAVLRAAADRRRPADDVAADAGRLPRLLRGARAATSESFPCTSPRSSRARSRARGTAANMLGDGRVRTIDTETASAAIAMLGIGDPAPARARHDRRGGGRARRAVPARATDCCSPSTRSSSFSVAGVSGARRRSRER